jgi:hypothetical protein
MTKQTFRTKRLLRRHLRRPRGRRSPRPTLTFTPTAWAKLHCLRDLGPTEVGGFGITDPDQSLCVQDIQLVQQRCTSVTVKFDDTAVAELEFPRNGGRWEKPLLFPVRRALHVEESSFYIRVQA